MKSITCNIPDSIHQALQERVSADHTSCDHIASVALATYLQKPIHTLFQVSTSAALVEGLFQGAMRVSRLLRHGDFGLGTFVDLDGEMVVLNGICYRVSSDGSIEVVEGERLIPYAVVTRFSVEVAKPCQRIDSFAGLLSACDDLRRSENFFHAFRVPGQFVSVKTRVMHAVPKGTGLKTAASGQEEFLFENVEGTLVGLWSPNYAGAFSVPGYHFHFISADKKRGGHVLECSIRTATIERCTMNEMHVSLPETEEFMKADLTRDPQSDLADAERKHE
jgi:acetolactate decarboxylase